VINNKFEFTGMLLFPAILSLGCQSQSIKSQDKPNVIFILTDDQGYGDLACHGNPWIKTPNIDKLYSQSVRFTNFHVGTTSSPSRSGLMTGNYCNKVGAWHTVKGREIMDANQTTIAEAFKEDGYTTGIFGKWHLGDNYPYRAQDRGFDESLVLKGGGIGNAPDYWDNDYFDDTYFHNGKPEKFNGYCTDIWFDNAMKFIKANKDELFFCYLSTNAPHSPYRVAEKYFKPYLDNDSIPNPVFYGMIANIDENIKKLREFLEKEGLAKNTVLVFMTDNGTAAGVNVDKNERVILGYNSGMSGKKGSTFEGGHRVPFFIYWENGGLTGGKDIGKLTSYVDFMPTLLDLCHIKVPDGVEFDGNSLVPLLYHPEKAWPSRILFTDTQREYYLKKYKDYCIMTDQWRLLNGRLYDIQNDPEEFNDVSANYPEVVTKLNAAYEVWWNKVSINEDKVNAIYLGSEKATEITLSTHDCHIVEGGVAHLQRMIRLGEGANGGHWVVEVVKDGKYQVDLRRWPVESGLKLRDPAPAGNPVPGDKPYHEGKALNIIEAGIKIGEQEFHNKVTDSDVYSRFNIDLKKGTYEMECRFTDAKEITRDAYYVYVSYLK
jgi:arylsulfatase A-like enzyme